MSAAKKRLTAAIEAFAARFRRPAKPKAVVKERLSNLEVSPEHAKATQACLPIGPSCC
jgi:hypothetical protein